MSSAPRASPPSTSKLSRQQSALGCMVLLVLVVAALFVWRSPLVSQFLLHRAWPLQSYRASTRHYHVRAAPEELEHLGAAGPLYITMNAAGQVLVFGGDGSMLWTPPDLVGVEAQLVDFNTVLHIRPENSHVAATALNAYGQVAGYADWSTPEGARSALFLWTPLQPHGSAGIVTYLTDPSPSIQDAALSPPVQGFNDYGQIVLRWKNAWLLWTPNAPNSPQGAAYPIRLEDQAEARSGLRLNAYGQLLGEANEHAFLWTPDQPHATTGAFTWLSEELEYVTDFNDVGQVAGYSVHEALLWTPTQPHATTGRVTRIPKPDGSDGVAFSALSPRGALVGSALSSNALTGPHRDAVVWAPDAPNAPSGQLQTLGALWWDEAANADMVNGAGTVLGESYYCQRSTTTTGVRCLQTHYFVWDHEQGMEELQPLLDAGSGYRLEGLLALNERGQILATGTPAAETQRLLLLTPH